MRQASRICLSRSHPGLQTSARTLVFNAQAKPPVPASLRPAPRATSCLAPPTGDTGDHGHEWGTVVTIPGPPHPTSCWLTASPCLSFLQREPRGRDWGRNDGSRSGHAQERTAALCSAAGPASPWHPPALPTAETLHTHLMQATAWTRAGYRLLSHPRLALAGNTLFRDPSCPVPG